MSLSLTAATLPGPRKDPKVAAALSRRRRRADRIVRTLCVAATLIALGFLASILLTLTVRGFEAMSLRVFTHVTAPPGSDGGLLNAIVGSLIPRRHLSRRIRPLRPADAGDPLHQ